MKLHGFSPLPGEDTEEYIRRVGRERQKQPGETKDEYKKRLEKEMAWGSDDEPENGLIGGSGLEKMSGKPLIEKHKNTRKAR